MSKKVEIACEGAALADIEDLYELQDDLKALAEEDYKKLREEIVNTGFAHPIAVWKGAKNKLWIVGGHQRKKTLLRMKSEGFSVPKVPITFTRAKNIEEAKRRVLQDITQYGKINAQGLYDFMEGARFKYEDIYSSFKLPDFDMGAFETQFYSESDPAPEPLPEGQDKVTSGAVPAGSVTKIILFYSVGEYSEISALAAKVGKKLGASNLSQLFSMLLKNESKR